MVNPVTVNLGIIVPLTGADVDTWGEDDVNPNMVAIDGLIGGVQTIGVTNVPVTLTAPAGFVATPSPGPTQSQNRVLRFTGVLSANVRITLPLPGSYLIDNRTTGNFVLSFQGVTATEVVGIEQGAIVEIYNDGANVRFVNLGRVGSMEFWGGIIAMPAWVLACTVPPYLLCDGTVSNFSAFPYLAARYLGQFGGNGITTFATPDMRGRVPLAYDGTGTRITTAGCGLNGQTMGATVDTQSITLNATQLPASIPYTDPGHNHPLHPPAATSTTLGNVWYFGSSNVGTASVITDTSVIGITINPGGGASHPNVQPSIVAGIWVAKT